MKVTVIGGGSWGTALAGHAAAIEHDVTLWSFEKDVVEDINTNHKNSTYLPIADLPQALVATDSLEQALKEPEIVLSVVPSQFLRSVVAQMKGLLNNKTIIVSASKGIENDTLLTPVAIYQDILGQAINDQLAALGGPSFAVEVAKKAPTAVVVASSNPSAAKKVQRAFSSDLFRIYSSDDVMGVELCGAVKNVIAVASGAVSGMGLGDNTRAALITRGIAEISRLVTTMGGSRQTVAGMAGIGDMVLTCTSQTSRNFTVGYRLGKGETLETIVNSMKMIAEGVRTTKSVYSLAETKNVIMPITEAVYSALYMGLEPRLAVQQLMSRELKHEWEPGEL